MQTVDWNGLWSGMRNDWNPQYCGQCCKPIVKAFYSGYHFGPIIDWSSMAAASFSYTVALEQ